MRIPLSWLIGLALIGTCYVPAPVSAERILFNPRQKAQLERVETIFVKTVTLTEKGRVEPTLIEKAATDRLTATGFTVVTTGNKPHDVVLKVRCDERKPWGGSEEIRWRDAATGSAFSKLERAGLPVELLLRRPEGTLAV